MNPDARRKAHRVTLPALGRTIECFEDETLFAAARRGGVRIVGACGGRGTCGSCIVRVGSGHIRQEDDTRAHDRKWIRACRVQPRSDLQLEIAPRSLAPVVRADVRTGGEGQALPLQPCVIAVELECEPATLDDAASDASRARRALAAQNHRVGTFDETAVAALPSLLRSHDWHVQARLNGEHLVAFVRPGAPLLGLAVDLGTTNTAAFLVDLGSGRLLASLGLENPQGAWGADLITRLNHAIQDAPVTLALHRAAVDAINALAHDLSRAVDASIQDIAEVVVCGNTAMQHLLIGWPVGQLARAPFVAACTDAQDLPARSLGLNVSSGTNLHVAPNIGGFVGGDHVATLLATEPLWRQPGNTLVMDIGTNTEISLLRDQGRHIWSTSCPSGPALEGGHIACGMRAAEGAIERVRIDAGSLRMQVIGDTVPIGLCGSGVLDALASFVRAGWVDARGRIVAPHAGVHDGIKAITLADENPAGPAVRFTQHDIRAVQLAKSAIRTGVELLAAEAGLAETDIGCYVIAGAFGAYVDIDNGVDIGLFPTLPRERFVQVGNAAGLGVQQMLASGGRRTQGSRLAAECRHVELSSRSGFQKTFLRHIGFAS